MHLTNYAVNKHNPDFVENNLGEEGDASKRSLAWLWDWMRARDIDPSVVWTSISDVIVKTLIAIQPGLAQVCTDTGITVSIYLHISIRLICVFSLSGSLRS